MRSHIQRLICFGTRTMVPSRLTVLAGRLSVVAIGLVLVAASAGLGSTPAAPATSAGPVRQGAPDETHPVRRSNPDENDAARAGVGAATAVMDFETRPLNSVTANIGHKTGEEPADAARDHLVRLQTGAGSGMFARTWPIACYQWESPALAHRPLYFEEVNLERYGYRPRHLRVVQPVVSAGQFFTTVVALPYQAFAEPARRPVYTLGHYRPGSNVPYQVIAPPWSCRGTAAQAIAVTGLIFLIP